MVKIFNIGGPRRPIRRRLWVPLRLLPAGFMFLVGENVAY